MVIFGAVFLIIAVGASPVDKTEEVIENNKDVEDVVEDQSVKRSIITDSDADLDDQIVQKVELIEDESSNTQVAEDRTFLLQVGLALK